MNEVRAAEEALGRQTVPQSVAQIGIDKTLQGKVISLAGRLPQIWAAPTTTDAQRKALLRCLIDKVVLDRGEHEVASVRIVWRGGAVTNLEVRRRVCSVRKLARGVEMRDRVLSLARDGMYDDQIAAVLTSEGHRSLNSEDRVLPITVRRIRHAGGVAITKKRTRWTHAIGVLTAPELAVKLRIPVNWLYVQIRKRKLLVDRHPSGSLLLQRHRPGPRCRATPAKPRDRSPRSQNLVSLTRRGINMRDRWRGSTVKSNLQGRRYHGLRVTSESVSERTNFKAVQSENLRRWSGMTAGPN